MKIDLDVNINRFRYSLVGDGYTLDEVESFSEERLKAILETRITQKILSEYFRGKRMGLFPEDVLNDSVDS